MGIMNLFRKHENSYSSILGLILKLDTTNLLLRKLLNLINDNICHGNTPICTNPEQAKLKQVSTQFAITNGLVDLVIEFECGEQRHHVYLEVKVHSNKEHGTQIDRYSQYVTQQNLNQNQITHTLGILTIPNQNRIIWRTPHAQERIQFALQWKVLVNILDNHLLANMDPVVTGLAKHFKKDIRKELLMDWENYKLQNWDETIALSFPVLLDGAYYLGKRIRQHLEVRGGGQQIYHFNTWYRNDAHDDEEEEHYFKVNLGEDRRLYIYWVYYENDEEFHYENFNNNWGANQDTVIANIDRLHAPGDGLYAGCLWVGKENNENGNRAAKIMKLSEFAGYFQPNKENERLELCNQIVEALQGL